MAEKRRKRIEIRPNRSLTPRGAVTFLLTTGLICLGPGVLLLGLGYWPVLPFAGIEFAALVAATWWTVRKSRYREIIAIGEATVRVDKLLPGRRIRTVMPVHWCTARLEPGRSRWSPQKLVLRTGMRGCEVASCLPDAERVQLWHRLCTLIGSVNETPQPRPPEQNPENPYSNQEVGTNVQ